MFDYVMYNKCVFYCRTKMLKMHLLYVYSSNLNKIEISHTIWFKKKKRINYFLNHFLLQIRKEYPEILNNNLNSTDHFFLFYFVRKAMINILSNTEYIVTYEMHEYKCINCRYRKK